MPLIIGMPLILANSARPIVQENEVPYLFAEHRIYCSLIHSLSSTSIHPPWKYYV